MFSKSFSLLPLAFATSALGSPSHGLHGHQHRHAVARNEGVPLLPGFELTWSDEFLLARGPQPLEEDWVYLFGTQYPTGSPRWGNNEFQSYTNSLENIHITKHNTLAITPRKSKNGTWTSARMETQQTFMAQPGGKLYIETRIKTGCADEKFQQGIWPAFWSLGESFRGNRTFWPMASEWDLVEVINGQPTTYNTLHCDVAPGGVCNEFNGIGNGGVPWPKCEWNIVGFEVDRKTNSSSEETSWRDEKITWFLNGEKTHEIPGSRINNTAVWRQIARQPHFLLLNLAIGGNWPGPPNNMTIDGPKVRLEVDYVRVWNTV